MSPSPTQILSRILGTPKPVKIAPSWVRTLFASEIEPLPGRSAADGPIVWRIRGDRSTATISEQFKANAGDYHLRYAASDHFQMLFQHALAWTQLDVAPEPAILDLGSGSGVNSVVPCLRLFPGARVIATDLSGQLLQILAEYISDGEHAEKVLCVVMDAMSQNIAPGQFDLVTGAAILHHLVHPDQAIAAASRALKPGGRAIFFEPFDGYGIIRLAYQRIAAEAALRGDPLDPPVRKVLNAMIADFAARTTPDVSTPEFAAMDDKWLFSRERIEAIARASGFGDVRFVPHNDHASLYRDVAAIQLRLATGQETLELPGWALAILDEFDQALPPAVKRLLMLEGTIVLTKA